MTLLQKARRLFRRMTPRHRANALTISLADQEIQRRRIAEKEHEERIRVEEKRKDIMRIVMSAKKPPEPKETTRYIVVDQDGQLVQTLEMVRRS